MRKLETKEEKFKRLAEKRVNRIVDELRLIGNLSNNNNYSYTPQQVKKIFNVIKSQVEWSEVRFSVSQKPKLFSLDGAKTINEIRKNKKLKPIKNTDTQLVRKRTTEKIVKDFKSPDQKIGKVTPVKKKDHTELESRMGICIECHSNRMLKYYRGIWICRNDWRKRKSIFKIHNHIKKQEQ